MNDHPISELGQDDELDDKLASASGGGAMSVLGAGADVYAIYNDISETKENNNITKELKQDVVSQAEIKAKIDKDTIYLKKLQHSLDKINSNES